MINIFNLNNSTKTLKNIVNKISNKETSWVNGIEIKNFEILTRTYIEHCLPTINFTGDISTPLCRRP